MIFTADGPGTTLLAPILDSTQSNALILHAPYFTKKMSDHAELKNLLLSAALKDSNAKANPQVIKERCQVIHFSFLTPTDQTTIEKMRQVITQPPK